MPDPTFPVKKQSGLEKLQGEMKRIVEGAGLWVRRFLFHKHAPHAGPVRLQDLDFDPPRIP